MKKTEKKLMGRPKADIDKGRLETIAKMCANEEDIAHYFATSKSTISKFIKDNYGMDFRTFRKHHMTDLKYKLISKVLKVINKELDRYLEKGGSINNALVMFTLKNMCGWKDKTETHMINEEDGLASGRPIVTFEIEAPRPPVIDPPKTIDVAPEA